MGNKYIEKFFLLTEQNILANESDTATARKNNRQGFMGSKYNVYLKYLLGALTIGLIYFFAHNSTRKLALNDVFFMKMNKTKVVAMSEPSLTSFIPSFRMAAHRQFLQHVYLKRVDLDLLDSVDLNENYMQQAKVTDKVLVVPKFFG